MVGERTASTPNVDTTGVPAKMHPSPKQPATLFFLTLSLVFRPGTGSIPILTRPNPQVTRMKFNIPPGTHMPSCIIARQGQPSHSLVRVVVDGSTRSPIYSAGFFVAACNLSSAFLYRTFTKICFQTFTRRKTVQHTEIRSQNLPVKMIVDPKPLDHQGAMVHIYILLC